MPPGVLKELTRKQDLPAHYGWDSVANLFSEYFGSRKPFASWKNASGDCPQSPLRIREQSVELGLSVGVSCLPGDAAVDADALSYKPRSRLIHARETGGGKVISR